MKRRPSEDAKKSVGRVQRNLFFLLVALTTLAFFGLVGPFAMTVFWAVVLTVIFERPYEWVLGKTKGKEGLAATLTTLGVLLFVLIPVVLLSIALVNQGLELYAQVESGELDVNVVTNYVERELPRVTSYLEGFGINTADVRERVQGYAVTLGQNFANYALGLGGSIVNLLIQFSLVLYLLWFFLRDGTRIREAIINTLPMGNTRERQLFDRFALVSRATLKGTLIVAVVQGSLGGIMFAILGIPAALLWGVVMTLLSLLPVGGSAIVWAPAAVILFAQGSVVKALVLFAFGALAIGLVDNLLRPILVGRDTKMPDYLVLVTTLGGIALFGLSGFVIGPTVAALFLTVWQMMGREYGGSKA